LAPGIASNIQVTSVASDDLLVSDLPSLRDLKPKQKAEIISLDDTVQGFTRRRFLDLGMTPGATIYPELENFFGEPRAYRIRGTLIALRSDQARQIKVKVKE
jgi:DtxR family Mn-dependent transcriptional regulator